MVLRLVPRKTRLQPYSFKVQRLQNLPEEFRLTSDRVITDQMNE